MKNKIILVVAFLCHLQVMAALSLVIKPLSGKECITALGSIGKIAYSRDSVFVYDNDNHLVFTDFITNVQHIRFSNESSSNLSAIEDIHEDNITQLLVYPNPTKEVLHIKNAQANLVRIYAHTGHLVQTITIEDNEVQLNISSYPSGCYLLLCGNKAFQVIKQ